MKVINYTKNNIFTNGRECQKLQGETVKKLLITTFLSSSLIAGAVQADSLNGGISSVTQDFKLGGSTTSVSNTGFYIAQVSELGNKNNLGFGFVWNNGTKSGSIGQIYLQPRINFNGGVSAFARLGYSIASNVALADSSFSGSFGWGIGGSYKINKSVGLEVSYDNLYSGKNTDITAISAGVMFYY